MADKTKRATWINSFEPEVALFVPWAAMKKVLEAKENKLPELPLEPLNEILRTKIGKLMFALEARQAQWSNHVAFVNDHIESLFLADWDPAEVNNFNMLMKRATRELGQCGVRAYDKQDTKLNYCGRPWKVEAQHVDDHWWGVD